MNLAICCQPRPLQALKNTATRTTCKGRSAFTLIELLVVLSIISLVMMVSFPMLGSMIRETKMIGAMKGMTAGIQETAALLTDYPLVDMDLTSPRIPGAIYTGAAFVVRWIDTRNEYEMFYAISNQTASGSAGPADYLCQRPTPIRGYSPVKTLEPIALGSGIRVAGLRRNNATPSKLELLPGSSFAICVNPSGTMIPYTQSICVNLQDVPITGSGNGGSPWDVWDTTLYDAPGATTGAYASTYRYSSMGSLTGNVGEAFLTALPEVVFYLDQDLPLSGNAPSGVPWRVARSDGQQVVNPALDVNELLKQTKGHLVVFSIQGSSSDSY